MILFNVYFTDWVLFAPVHVLQAKHCLGRKNGTFSALETESIQTGHDPIGLQDPDIGRPLEPIKLSPQKGVKLVSRKL